MAIAISRKFKTLAVGCLTIRGFTETRVFSLLNILIKETIMNKYKPPLQLKEQTKHLKEYKNIVFNDITEESAQEYLLMNNYINVISPFKYKYAKKDENGVPLKDGNDNHIYENITDFSTYKKDYEDERIKYVELFNKISVFEKTFNSIVSYNVLTKYNIENSDKFNEFVNTMFKVAAEIKLYSVSEKIHMIEEISRFISKINKYNSPYIFFDRLTLSETITIYRLLPFDTKKKIFKKLKSINCTMQYQSMGQFDEALTRLTKVRNCVYHGNSLTILIRYYDIKNKELRYSTDKKKYETLIKHLLN